MIACGGFPARPAARPPPRAALALTRILHELVSNTMKYGALSTPDGV